MSEETYRQQLHEAFRRGRRRDGKAALWKTGEGRDADGAEAVAAQVLRDLIDSAPTMIAWCTDCGGAVDWTKRFAAERGIDIGGPKDMSGYTARDYEEGKDNQP